MAGVALTLTALSGARAAAAEIRGPTIFAAASMKTALDAIAAKWQAQSGASTVLTYGSSATLAKQIANGAPADLFISADLKWMSYLENSGAIRRGTRDVLLGNALVLIAPKVSHLTLTIGPGFDLAGALGSGRLATCLVASCPAGIYAKQALESLNVWSAVEPKIAQAENVRAALQLVARGEAKLGIVYATDAKAEPAVKVLGTFPASSHAPIVYPVAIVNGSSNPEAARFEAFLRSPQATRILEDQGFAVLPR